MLRKSETDFHLRIDDNIEEVLPEGKDAQRQEWWGSTRVGARADKTQKTEATPHDAIKLNENRGVRVKNTVKETVDAQCTHLRARSRSHVLTNVAFLTPWARLVCEFKS